MPADQHPHGHHALADQDALPGVQHEEAQVDGQPVGGLGRRLGQTELPSSSKARNHPQEWNRSRSRASPSKAAHSAHVLKGLVSHPCHTLQRC